MIVTGILFALALATGFLVGDYTAIMRVRRRAAERKALMLKALQEALQNEYSKPGPWDHMLPANATEETKH